MAEKVPKLAKQYIKPCGFLVPMNSVALVSSLLSFEKTGAEEVLSLIVAQEENDLNPALQGHLQPVTEFFADLG